MCLLQRLVCVAISTSLLLHNVNANSQSRNPLTYLTLLDSARIHTPSQRVHYSSSFDLTFELHENSQRIRLSLEPNHDIFDNVDGSYIEYLDINGNVRHNERLEREEHKVYLGKSWIRDRDGHWTNVGFARIYLRRDGIDPLFEGAFSILGDHHHIQLKSNYMQTRHSLDPWLEDSEDEYMAVFRDSDVAQKPKPDLMRSTREPSCPADMLEFNTRPEHPVYNQVLKRDAGQWGSMSLSSLLYKRQIDNNGNPGNSGNSAGVNLKSTIGDSAGCSTTRKVALIGVATDCGYTSSFNSTDSVRQNVITQVNSASDLYQSTFNITLGLRTLTVSDAECPSTTMQSAEWNVPCSSNATIDSRLSLFSAWRAQRQDTNAYWSLFSTCNTGAEVGLAWLGQLCNNGAQTNQATDGSQQSVSGVNVVVRTSTEWQVFAHETGHTFGAVHDCTSQTCSDGTTVNAQQCCPLSGSTCNANGQYIMNPSSVTGISTFSPCTLGNICAGLGRNSVQTKCLSDNKGVNTITGNQCGNGIVEEGEQCDCGGTEGCGTDNCCDATTCKFKIGAVCDPTNEVCCTSSCQFASSDTVCRASPGTCDPQETCSGNNGMCPPDITTPDGTACGNSSQGLQCASGQCTSRDLQCKILMGSYTTDNDTYACNSQTCTLSCASPDFGPDVCYSMQQNFLDGTPCGGGGKCDNGQCHGSTAGGEFKSWIDDNKPLVIGLAAGIGGLLLLAFLSCIIRACRRPKKSKRRGGHRPRHTGGWAGQQQPPPVWNGPMPPQQQQRGGWYDGPSPGPGQWAPPSPAREQWKPPPPTYAPPNYPGNGSGGSSVRYA